MKGWVRLAPRRGGRAPGGRQVSGLSCGCTIARLVAVQQALPRGRARERGLHLAQQLLGLGARRGALLRGPNVPDEAVCHAWRRGGWMRDRSGHHR